MNREQAKELLPVIQAFAEGKEVECRARQPHDTFGPWIINKDPIWSSNGWEHRIKPDKPASVVFWVNVYDDETISTYPSEHRAKAVGEADNDILLVIARRVELEIGEGE